MRSLTWITVLIALFMFQSFWNVAAAFCDHEKMGKNATQLMHFGHHEATLHDLMHQANSKQKFGQTHEHQAQMLSDDVKSNDENHLKKAHQQLKIDLTQDDHSDHLPSMGHLIVPKIKAVTLVFKATYLLDPDYIWTNAYQSPDLIHQTPPPEFSPLMVG